jgi:hypothetical protein
MKSAHETTPCPLCAHPADAFCFARSRDYLRCPQCDLIFVHGRFHLPPDEEKLRYDCHENDPDDPRYRNFLNRLFQPLEKKLTPGMHGLDFGCGPGPTLSLMLREAGFPCAEYDLHYADDPSVLKTQYDFLTCSETLEHLYRPREELERFLALVRPGGWIGMMTQLHDESPVPFERWHYIHDETHVCFYSKKTFRWLTERYRLKAEFYPHGVTLLQLAES